MKKALFLTLAMFAAITMAGAQEYIEPVETWKVSEVWGNNYHGWSFHQDWEVDFTVENQDGRFTPTDAEIAEAERLVQKRIAYLNRDHYNQGGMCPIIDEHMNKYERQYVGFTDIYGFRVAWVNFLWDDKVAPRVGKDIILTSGGCGHYWHVLVNLDTEKVFGLEVNAPGDVQYLPRVKKPGPRISRPKKDHNPKRIRKTGIIHTESEKQFN